MESARVGLRALKGKLSSFVARARAGEEIIVTTRGVPVARLMPVTPDDPFKRLVAEGIVERAPPRRRRISSRPTVRLRGRGPSMSDYVAAQRR